MDTVGEILVHVSGQLSDQRQGREFSRWPRAALVDYLNRALLEIATYRPDAFTSEINLSLASGALQKLDTSGDIEQITVGGQPLQTVDAGIYKAFSAYSVCPPPVRRKNGRIVYTPKSIAIDPNVPGQFYISPPVPLGAAGIVATARVTGQPAQYDLTKWDRKVAIQGKFINNVITYMLACAYGRDTESRVSGVKSQQHFSLFYQTMDAKYKIDSAASSGYYKGQIGTGDPRAAR